SVTKDRPRSDFKPLLRLTALERAEAWRTLNRLGITAGDTIVGIHGGASDARRMWPLSSYLSVARSLDNKYRTKTLLFLEPDAEAPDNFDGASVRTSLREMMALFTCCTILMCNDSGPMHIADALDVPVVAVFLTGNPVWHRPYRPNQEVVGEGTGHDFLVAPTEDGVLAAAERQLSRRAVQPSKGVISEQARA
ncbi:MAG: glycosyltransferase family 9 protein, partial [Gemmatimonadales bacterium]